MTTDANETYWVLWINRKTGETGSVFQYGADSAWKYTNEINKTPNTNFQAFVVGKR